MIHRHLHSGSWSPAAIDDMIDNGSMDDWRELQQKAREEERVRAFIRQVCAFRVKDPLAQRHHFWKLYVERLDAR